MSNDKEFKIRSLLKTLMNPNLSRYNPDVIRDIQEVMNNSEISQEDKLQQIDNLFYFAMPDERYPLVTELSLEQFRSIFEEVNREEAQSQAQERLAQRARNQPSGHFHSKETPRNSGPGKDARGLKKSRKIKKAKKVKTSKKNKKSKKSRKIRRQSKRS